MLHFHVLISLLINKKNPSKHNVLSIRQVAWNYYEKIGVKCLCCCRFQLLGCVSSFFLCEDI
jgi:hypothetical protein